jgi:hypothetical protein
MAVFEKKELVRGFQFMRSTETEIDMVGSEAYDQEIKIEADLPGFYIRRVEIIKTPSKSLWDDEEDADEIKEPKVILYVSQDWYFDGEKQETQEFHLQPGAWLIEDCTAYSGYSVYSEAKIEELKFRKI